MVAPRVVALGEVLVEIMRPAAGSPLDAPGLFAGPFMSGAPAIFAGACARLGVATALVGTVGDDAFGRLIRAQGQCDGLNLTYLHTDPDHATGCAFVAYDASGQREFIFHLRDAAAGTVLPVWPPTQALAGVAWLHVCGSTLALSAGWWEVMYRAARQARERGAHVSFDPNIRPELLGGRSIADVCGPFLRLADVVLPSGSEAKMLTGEPDAGAACGRLLEFGADFVVLKRGPLGATIFTGDGNTEVAPFPVQEVDPTGAGDVFAAALACGLLADMPLRDAVRQACAAGALAVTVQGPLEGAPTRDALEALLRNG